MYTRYPDRVSFILKLLLLAAVVFFSDTTSSRDKELRLVKNLGFVTAAEKRKFRVLCLHQNCRRLFSSEEDDKMHAHPSVYNNLSAQVEILFRHTNMLQAT